MVLSPNDEEVASSKKHTQFKTSAQTNTLFQNKIVKIDTLFQTKTVKKHTFWCRTYLCSLYEGVPPSGKTALQTMSLVAYASETKQDHF